MPDHASLNYDKGNEIIKIFLICSHLHPLRIMVQEFLKLGYHHIPHPLLSTTLCHLPFQT
jgi:hypothetical protein